jgi:hypothetical protein
VAGKRRPIRYAVPGGETLYSQDALKLCALRRRKGADPPYMPLAGEHGLGAHADGLQRPARAGLAVGGVETAPLAQRLANLLARGMKTTGHYPDTGRPHAAS